MQMLSVRDWKYLKQTEEEKMALLSAESCKTVLDRVLRST